MTGKAPLKGKWRIVEMPTWDADHLHLLGPAYIEFDGKGAGEIAFGAFQAALECATTPSGVDFDWHGFDKWMRLPARVGSNSTKTARSAASSLMTTATTQTCELSRGDFFNSLLNGNRLRREIPAEMRDAATRPRYANDLRLRGRPAQRRRAADAFSSRRNRATGRRSSRAARRVHPCGRARRAR